MNNDPNANVAMKVVVDGQERAITFEELTLSNNLAQEALVSLLIRKKIIDPKELLEEITRVRKERYRSESDMGPQKP